MLAVTMSMPGRVLGYPLGEGVLLVLVLVPVHE